MGAVGTALLAKAAGGKKAFDWEIARLTFQTRARTCAGCANHCEIISFYRDGSLLDFWGNRCEKGQVMPIPASGSDVLTGSGLQI